MMPPPFPFLPPGMTPPAGMPIPPFKGGTGMMPWFNDPMFTGAMMPPHLVQQMDGKAPEYQDDNKDIFGKPVQKASVPKKQVPASKLQAKPDLFEPQ